MCFFIVILDILKCLFIVNTSTVVERFFSLFIVTIMKKTILSSVLLLSSFAAPQAFAGTSSETFNAEASVDRVCKIDISNPSVVFNVDAMATTETKSSFTAINVYCSIYSKQADAAAFPIAIRYSEGLNSAAGSTCDAPLRRMKSNDGSYVSYRLSNVVHPTLGLGCGSNTVEIDSATPTEGYVELANQREDYTNIMPNYKMYTRRVIATVPAGQDLNINTYTDTITISVDF